MNKIKELTGKKMLLAVAVLCTFGFAGNLAKSVAGSQHIRVGGPYH